MTYKLTHPDTDVEIERDADQVANYEKQGWCTKPGANPPATKDPEDK